MLRFSLPHLYIICVIALHAMQIPWQAGTEVVALYKFPGNSPEDLPFKRGDILTIVHSCMVRATDVVVIQQTTGQHN